MKKILSTLILALCLLCSTWAQVPDVRSKVLNDSNLAAGQDAILNFTEHSITPAPKGYEAFYISHYGRHGSRYAYTSHTYTDVMDMLENGVRNNNLTDQGKALYARLKPFYETVQYRVGDLTPAGWEQEKQIADAMVRDYPTVFRGKPVVDACASSSIRSILSMSSCCLELGQVVPAAEIVEHQGLNWIQATAPNSRQNPFRYKGEAPALPFSETNSQFLARKLDYNAILGRIFKNTNGLLEGKDLFWAIDYFYMIVAGMNSVPDDVMVDVSDIFTPEEYATMWEVDNYERFLEFHDYLTPCSAILDDMIDDSDARLVAGTRGADLRFGHDHCILPLLEIADIENFGHEISSPDEVANWFQNFRCAMGSNLQFVFFRPKGGKGLKCSADDILVKILLNGEEVSIHDINAVDGPYYAWPTLRSWIKSRIDIFVSEK